MSSFQYQPVLADSKLVHGLLSISSVTAKAPKSIQILQVDRVSNSGDLILIEYEIDRRIKESKSGNIYLGYLLTRLPQEQNAPVLYCHSTSSSSIRPVTLKVFKKSDLSLMPNQSAENPLQGLYNIQNVASHTNLLKALDITCDRDTGDIYFVREYCNGGELYDYIIQNGPLQEDVAKVYFKQIIQCVQHIHNQGYVHRDISLENLLLHKPSDDSCGVVKLANFGHSLKLPYDESTDERSVNIPLLRHYAFGRYNCVAPEIIWSPYSFVETPKCSSSSSSVAAVENCTNSFAYYDPRLADIWSAGVCLFILLTGYPPFQKIRPCTSGKNTSRYDYTPRDPPSFSLQRPKRPLSNSKSAPVTPVFSKDSRSPVGESGCTQDTVAAALYDLELPDTIEKITGNSKSTSEKKDDDHRSNRAFSVEGANTPPRSEIQLNGNRLSTKIASKLNLKERHVDLGSCLSQDAFDLLCRILQPEPRDRITIEDILKHPWLVTK